MSVQSRTFSAPQLSPGNFVQPAPPGSSNLQQNFSSSSSATLNFISPSSSAIFHRNPPRDPFTLSAPPSTTVATLPGSGGLFLSPSVNSHSGFVPSRIGERKIEAPIMKPPKPPEKPLMPYMRYSRRMWEKVRLSNPDSKLWDIGKIIGQMWRELPESSRQVYVDEYEIEKQEYDRAMKTYHNSPSYQAYLVSKNRGRGGEKPGGGISESGGVYIQPVDEDEGDAGQLSAKQLAASRFHRNHRLMKEIFGETQVPDARNVITAQRLGVLKKQVNSLTLHQNKLEEELKQLEAKFETKKRKMDESSSQFSTTLKKICSQKIDPFEELVEKSKAQLLNAYEQYKIQEQKQREAALNESSQPQPPPPSSSIANEEPKENSDSAGMDQSQPSQDAPAPPPADGTGTDSQDGTRQEATDTGSDSSESPTADEGSKSKQAENVDDGQPKAEDSEEKSEKPKENDDDDKKESSNDGTPADDGSENSQEA